jgi:galactokinase
MWHFDHDLPALPDTERFLTALGQHEDFFSATGPVWVGRAPGRLDLMGGIADYSGSLVLELPLAVATWVAVQAVEEPVVSVFSTALSPDAGEPLVSLPLPSLQVAHSSIDYDSLRAQLTSDAARAWSAYILGGLLLLQQNYGFVLQHGLHFFIYSDVPEGKGVSSSAALEVAAMQAMSALFNLEIAGRDLALLCQQVENRLVGAPCGIMDQMTSACGEQESLLALLCQPAELQPPVVLPSEIEVWGIDSGIRHAVTGADYGSVRVGAFMGYRILADKAGLQAQVLQNDQVSIDDPLWHGYLANIPVSLWAQKYADLVPENLDGAAFLERYGGSTDTVTRIDPARTYAVRRATAHPIHESHRVHLFRTLLGQSSVTEEQLQLLGELMYQSHASYSSCGLGSSGTDLLVDLVRSAGPSDSLYGAKITGGGSGGTVAVLSRRGASDHIQDIMQRYRQQTGLTVTALHGSSPGAIAWGAHRLHQHP